MNRTWLILDCDYLCHRAKHTTGDLSYDGQATGVIYGFLKEVAYLMDYFQTKYIIFCWDSRTNKRKQIYKQYKANRKDRDKDLTEEEQLFEQNFHLQMKKLREVYLKTIGFRNVFYVEGYESDDIIASLCQHLPPCDFATIVSADHDLYQLLTHFVTMYNPHQRKMMTRQIFISQYTIKPESWARVKAIAGCSSDNVKGVAGVGEKTAIKFLKDELKKDSKAYSKIVDGKRSGMIKRNLHLTHLPFKNTPVCKLKKDKLSEEGWKQVVKQLGFKSLRERCPFI